MRYLPLLIALTGCATTPELNQVRFELNQVRFDLIQASKKLDASVYHLQAQTCKTDVLICGLNSAVRKTGEEACMENYKLCLTTALDQYRAVRGHEPPDLFEPKRAR
jgi:hypothetical protein